MTTFRQQMADFARGQRLRELREGKHESQENVAYAVGVSAKTLRAWEHGGKIRWPNAKRLGSFYGVDPEALVSRENGETPDLLPADGELSQLARIEAGINEILEWVRRGAAVPEAAEAAESELEALPALLSKADAQPKRPARQRSSKRQAVGQRKSA